MEKKQRILMIHNHYQIPGGEDLVFENEQRLLEENGHYTYIYTRDNNEIKNYGILRKLMLPFITIFNLKTYYDIQRIIKEKEIDIVHVHNTLLLVSPSVYYAAIRCGKPIVQTIHNYRLLCPAGILYREGRVCEDCVNGGLICAIKHSCYRNSLTQTICYSICLWIHRRTGVLSKIYYICLTDFARKKIGHLKNIDMDKVFIKPNFVYECEYSGDSNRYENYYFFAGRIEEIKGVRIVIDAFCKLKNTRIVLAGDGPLFKELSEYAQKNNKKNIEFIGHINHERILEFMRNAKAVIVSPQTYEMFPMTILDALSVGTPVITGDIGNASVLIEQGKTGLKFKYDSSDALANAVIEYEQKGKDYFSKIAYKTFEERYTPMLNYTMLKKIYSCIESKQFANKNEQTA